MEKIKDASKVSELQDKIEKLKDEAEYYEKHKAHLQNDTKGLESKFVELINGYSEKVADVTFDGFMSSKMLQAASSWEKKEEIDELARRVTTLNVMDKDTMDKDELVDYIVRTVQILRPSYSKNTIVNILTCVSQGFLTVFSGMPGCGKTSICNIISRVLGLNNYERVSAELKNVSRYIQVSVERGWTSKRDFIGYYNPLTKAFEESNREVYDALQLLDMESRSDYRKWPFFILLDEANLSPMEYYWADFMNVCDDLRDNSFINLGNDNIFKIPETLHFLATINNDHTTETLSPRLIDRAWIISLPKVNELHSNIDIPEDQIKPISWEELMTTFSYADEERKTFDRESQAIFDGIKDKLAKQELYLSPRVRIAIERYWLVASRIMEEDEYGNSSSVIALDYAISQKILPKLIGSGDEYEAFLEDLKKYCDEKNLSYTTELLTSMINRGNRQMKYYQFFN
jgi:MoxR-like ATPase